MGYWKETKKVNGKELVYYRVYCGRDSDGVRIQKSVKTEAEAKRIEARYKSNNNDVDKEILALPMATKMEFLVGLRVCVKYDTNYTAIIKSWLENRSTRATMKVRDGAALFLAFLKETNKRDTYCKTFRQWLAAFCDVLGDNQVGSITTDMLKPLYCKIPIKSRQTWKARANTFFSWAMRNKHADSNPAENLEVPRTDKEVPHILSVRQCQTLMANCPVRALGALILMLFAGVRPAEAKQITSEAVSREKRILTIGAKIAKTRAYRIVPLTDNMMEWFDYIFAHKQRLPYTQSNNRLTESWAKILQLQSWPRDCLRHTAASMMLARDKNADKVSLELGNSPGVLHRHYKNLVTDSDCESFWRLTPVSSGRELLLKRKQLTSKSGLEYID